MRFRQIEAFRAVMAHGSATAAAEALYISQPAVSRLLADFEADLGVRLFERDRGRLKPTREAHLLFQESEMAFSGITRLKEAATAVRQLQRGHVRIASETVYAEGFIPRIAAAYQRLHPEVRIELDTGPSARIAEWIAETWYDVGIVVLPIPEADVAIRPLRRQRALCVLPADHRLAGRQSITLIELAEENFIAPVADTPYRRFFDRAMKRAGIAPDIRMVARTQHGICSFVAAGAGVGLVDPCAAEDMQGADIRFVPFEPRTGWDLAVATSKLRPPSLVAQDFVNYLVSAAAAARQKPATCTPGAAAV